MQPPGSSETQLDVSIIVVSYNTRALTLACLDAIAAETRSTHEVLVVDNASTDGSAESLARHPSHPRLMLPGRNLGFAAANNLAARDARGTYILLLNPDTVVRDGAIDKLLAFARSRPRAGIWGGRTVFADGSLNASSCWGRMTPWNLACRATGLTGIFPDSGLFNGEAYGGWRRDSEAAVDIVSGCFLLIRRELWQRLDGFDPAFFMYGEEADLCLRAAALGFRPMVTPDATIVHLGGASEPTRTAKMTKLLAAKALLIRRHWRPSLRPLGLALMAAWPLSRWMTLALAGRMKPAAGYAAQAEVWRTLWQSRTAWLGAYDDRAVAAPHSPAAAQSSTGR